MGMKVVVLISGGMDTVTALHHARVEHEVVASISVDCGSKHNQCEIPSARRHSDALDVTHTVIPLKFIAHHLKSDPQQSGRSVPGGHYEEANMKSTVVPFGTGITTPGKLR